MMNEQICGLAFRTITIAHRGFDFDISYFIRAGEGETILYLHGLGSTKYDFLEATRRPELDGFTLVAFDFPGSGNSSSLNFPKLGMHDLVEITARLISDLRLGRVSLVGHSMGGLVALLFTRRYPEMVKRLVSVEGNLAREDCNVLSRETAQLSWEAFEKSDFMRRLQERFALLPYHGARLYADSFRNAVSASAFHQYCESIFKLSEDEVLLPLFRELKVPRMFMYGDANKGLSYLPELRNSAIPCVEVPQSHHWPYLDNPDYFFQMLARFVGQGTLPQSEPAVDQVQSRPNWVYNIYDQSRGNTRKLGDGLNARIYTGKNLMLSVVSIEPHSLGPIHSHPEEQWGILLEGECTPIQDGEEVPVARGDLWHTPSNAPHGIRTGEKGAFVLDVFSPPRSEFQNG